MNQLCTDEEANLRYNCPTWIRNWIAPLDRARHADSEYVFVSLSKSTLPYVIGRQSCQNKETTDVSEASSV